MKDDHSGTKFYKTKFFIIFTKANCLLMNEWIIINFIITFHHFYNNNIDEYEVTDVIIFILS